MYQYNIIKHEILKIPFVFLQATNQTHRSAFSLRLVFNLRIEFFHYARLLRAEFFFLSNVYCLCIILYIHAYIHTYPDIPMQYKRTCIYARCVLIFRAQKPRLKSSSTSLKVKASATTTTFRFHFFLLFSRNGLKRLKKKEKITLRLPDETSRLARNVIPL